MKTGSGGRHSISREKKNQLFSSFSLIETPSRRNRNSNPLVMGELKAVINAKFVKDVTGYRPLLCCF